MPVAPSAAPTTSARRLTVSFYLYAFLDEFVLLYPVYALLFTDTGLSVAQISSLFVIWSLTGIVLEVPSGVWADAVSRRLLLAGAPLLGAVGFGLWVVAPSYWAFALGFVLWGARGALQSGAAEALLFDELDRLGVADRYGRVIGRASTIGLLAALLAIAVAGPVFAAGGYVAVGAASVLASLLCAVVGLTLPEHRAPVPVGGPGGKTANPGSPGYLAILRSALAEARQNPGVRRALLLLPAMLGIWGALEEYVPLLAGAVAPASGVPLLVLLVWLGVMLGGLLTPIGQRLPAGRFAVTVGAAPLALALGALTNRPAGFVLVAAAFCVLQMASLVADVRLQESIGGSARATMTSLAGLGTELVTIGVYGGYALASTVAGHGTIFALFALPYLALAVALRRAGPPAEPGSDAREGVETN
ncbi:MFS transporter [Plantactinospora sp. WMMC1484]|uniref:MFS transporter n=1 Tax=Plantactinospora sp. WMMC1484 TaxID=3404122 RepID=UPI003BF51549